MSVSSAAAFVGDGTSRTEQSLAAYRHDLQPDSQYFRTQKFQRHMPILLCKYWHRKVALARKKIRDSCKWCSVMMSCDPQLLPDQRLSSMSVWLCHNVVELLLLDGHQAIVCLQAF